jgi:hypothetical protein
MAPDQFSDRNGGGFLGDGFMGGYFMAIDGGIWLPTKVSMANRISCADRAIECLIRTSNNWVTENQDAELGRFSIGGARGFCVQDRQLDREMDSEIGKGFNARAHATRMHFAGRYHDCIASASKALCSATPK